MYVLLIYFLAFLATSALAYRHLDRSYHQKRERYNFRYQSSEERVRNALWWGVVWPVAWAIVAVSAFMNSQAVTKLMDRFLDVFVKFDP